MIPNHGPRGGNDPHVAEHRDGAAERPAPAQGIAVTSRVARVYDRIASLYDWYEAPMDRMGGRERRARVIGDAHGRVLEVGVGTGRNLALYPEDARVTGIDVSERMLVRARERAAELDREVELRHADAEA